MPVLGGFIVPHPPLLLPQIGQGRESGVRRTAEAYREVCRRIAALRPDTVVISSPHTVMYADYYHISPGTGAVGDFGEFGYKGISLAAEYDGVLAEGIARAAMEGNISAGMMGEKNPALDHGTMIPLWFLNEVLTDYRIVRLGLSGLPLINHYQFGKCVKKACESASRRVVFLASGDLSHCLTDSGPYGYTEEGPVFDKQAVEAMETGSFIDFLHFPPDFLENAGECGLRSFVMLAGALDGAGVRPELLSYEGPYGVGYAVAAFEISGRDTDARCFDRIYESEQKILLERQKAGEDAYVRLARLSLETYVKTGERIGMPEGMGDDLGRQKAGVFVSLKKDGELRGCIGTISPLRDCVAQEIIWNALSAGLEDPRFMPVTEAELPYLIYSVDVLSVPIPVTAPEELDASRYGIIVSQGEKRGLLLPELEGVDTVERQLEIARKKGGITEAEPFTVERFEVLRHL